MKKVGILDNDEKEALEGQQYAPNRFFTPLHHQYNHDDTTTIYYRSRCVY